MKKILEDMIIKWHQCGYSVEEIQAERTEQAERTDQDGARRCRRHAPRQRDQR